MKHTPGPWRLLPPTNGIDRNWRVTDSGDTFVAHVFGFNHAVDEQSKINARLIAAAPELLEACKAAAKQFDEKSPVGRILSDAIAKAEGNK